MMSMRRFLAWMLVFTLLAMSMNSVGYAGAAPASQAKKATAENTVSAAPSLGDIGTFSPFSKNKVTWAQGARFLCRLLGYMEEDAAAIDMAEYASMITGLNAEDDSLYLGILAANGYLASAGTVIDPKAIMAQADYEKLLNSAYSDVIASQEDADKLTAASDIKNLAAGGGTLSFAALSADRILLGKSDRVTLSGSKASVLSLADGASVYLKGTELDRAVIGYAGAKKAEKPTFYLHVDSESKLPEIILDGTGDVTIEGNGALGIVRILGDTGAVTVRATCSVINATSKDVTVTGPDGQAQIISPKGQTDFVLNYYLVSFVTDGTPVPSKMLSPGDALDYNSISTTKKGSIFTAWYEDAGYTIPHSTFGTVDGELTLYARFISKEEAVTVTFETNGGSALEPLVFSKGENLLCKPVSGLYTSKEGYSFGGWCTDEACLKPFGYTDPIEGSMTLYALFTSNEPEEDQKKSSTAQLDNIDWKAEIPLTVPKGMTLKKLKSLVKVEAGTGISEPTLSFKKTKDGYAAYGKYFKSGGKTGFEPGSSFTITVSGGVCFAGYAESVQTLAVSVFKEETEVVEFAKGLTYILWDQVLSYEPVVQSKNEQGEEISQPGTVVLKDTTAVGPGEILVLYDGKIGKSEKNIASWKEGSFDGFVLFANVLESKAEEGRTAVSFAYANPEDYLQALDVHVKNDVNIEDTLDQEQIGRIKKDIVSQVMDNDELKAQMLVAVMTTPQAQAKLDELYGKGVYQLASVSASLKPEKPTVTLSLSGSTVSVKIAVSATIELKNGEEVILTIKPTLSFEEAVSLQTQIDGGFVWIDASARIMSTSTIKLEITANSGEDSDLDILSEAKDTLAEIITPDGIDDSMDYMESVDKLMTTMQSLVATSLPYNDLFVTPLFNISVTFYGIVTLSVKLELVGQIGVLATFGIEIIVTNGERIGFRYNFLKSSGGSYKEKLADDVRTQIYLIGKIGARLGLRLTITVSLCGVANASITGELFAYAELTGMIFYTASLITGSSTYVGALYFEVGLDASISLTLGIDLFFVEYSKTWTLWQERWPLYNRSLSSTLSIMDINQLDEMWAVTAENADNKSSFGFANVPMLTYTLLDGSCVHNQLLWDTDLGSGVSLKLSVENLTIDGEPVAPGDPRNALLTVGDISTGRSAGRIYLDEKIAAQYLCRQSECDVVITYENTNPSALVKKQSHTFHLSRQCSISTTTVNVQVKLYDWCAHSWGIEAAAWDNALLYETKFESSHMVGGLCAPTETGLINLNAIANSAVERYPELGQIPLSWFDRTVNSAESRTMQYSIPRISNLCYMTPENGTVRYDVHPETYEYTLVWYLYASRLPGYKGDISYIVKLGNPAAAVYDFSVTGSDTAEPMHFVPDATVPATWSLAVPRSAFDGTVRPLMMSVDGTDAVETGLSITGREQEEKVVLNVDQKACAISITAGDGISSYAVVSPGIASGDLVMPGTRITLSAEPKDGYRNVELVSSPKTLAFSHDGNQVTFTMPAYAVDVSLVAYPVHKISYLYNYGNLGAYKTADIAANEKITSPVPPFISGLTFRGWFETPDCAGDPYAFGQKAEDDLILYADWTCDVTVDFVSAAGQAAYLGENGLPALILENDYAEYYRYTYSTLRVGDKLIDVLLPNYSGHDFLGWYLTEDYIGAPVDLQTYTLAGGVTLYARWAKVISVRYAWNHETLGTYLEVPEHQGLPLANMPVDPVLDWHKFGSWYSQPGCAPETKIDPAAFKPAEDMTLYAGWTAEPFAITYDLGGGENNSKNPSAYTVDSGNITLAAPTRTGYSFNGWTGTELSGPELSVTIPAGSHIPRSYTALWTPVKYTVAYDLVRGTLTVGNPAEYTIESPEFTLNNPVKDKYEFMGWTGTGLTSPALTVTIPTGSYGNRSYTGTWTTDDPASIIADNALAAISGQYDAYTVDDYVPGTGAEGSLYNDILASIAAGSGTSAYMGDITLTLETLSGSPAESADCYTYSFTATVVYTDDTGTPFDRLKTVNAVVYKRVPVIETPPSASDLNYGQPLSVSSLTDGKATFGGAEVTGSFAWSDGAVVPLGKDNGSAIYQAVFTPADPSMYAVVPLQLAVYTQIGVQVSITADDRDYVKDDTSAAGSYVLKDADTSNVLTDITLKDEAYHFAQAAPGEGITVTCSGYSLAVPPGQENLYVLRNDTASAAASIRWITPALTAPSASPVYGDILRDVTITGGSAMYGSSAVPGTWAWASPSHIVNQTGAATFDAVFTPSDTAGYKSGTVSVAVNIAKKTVAVPAIGAGTYTGSRQAANISETSDYTVTQNSGGTDAGSYPVVLALKNTEYYRWSDGAFSGAEATLNYVIAQAALDVNTAAATVAPLGYGQKLTAGSKNGYLEIPANEMISGTQVSFGGTTVSGIWTWDVSGLTQPLNAGSYPVNASFSASISPGNFTAVTRPFTVVINPAVPYVAGVTLTASPIYQPGEPQNPLSRSTLSASGTAINPVTGDVIPGGWSWEAPNHVTGKTEELGHGTVFTPNDTANYTTALSSANITFRDYVIVTITQNSRIFLDGGMSRLFYTTDLEHRYSTLSINLVPGNDILFGIWLAHVSDDAAHKTYPVYMSSLYLAGMLGTASKSVFVTCDELSQPTYYEPNIGIIKIANIDGAEAIAFSESNMPSDDLNITVTFDMSMTPDSGG